MASHHRSHHAQGTAGTVREHGPHVSLAGAVVVATIAAILGFGLGFKVAYRQFKAFAYKGPASAPASAQPAPVEAQEAATSVTYRGVVDAVAADRLSISIMEGAPEGTGVTLLVTASTRILALRPVTAPPQDLSGWDFSKGLPPPPKTPSEPYEAATIPFGELAVGDVVEFEGAAGVEDGATVTPGTITWIMYVGDLGPQGGPRGDGAEGPKVLD